MLGLVGLRRRRAAAPHSFAPAAKAGANGNRFFNGGNGPHPAASVALDGVAPHRGEHLAVGGGAFPAPRAKDGRVGHGVPKPARDERVDGAGRHHGVDGARGVQGIQGGDQAV